MLSSSLHRPELPSFIVVIAMLTLAGASFPPYELIFETRDRITELSGEITLYCRNAQTTEKINVQSVKIWLNASSCEKDLRQREDIGRIEVVGCCSLRFNLTRNLEGNYSCGEFGENGIRLESSPLRMICEWIMHIAF